MFTNVEKGILVLNHSEPIRFIQIIGHTSMDIDSTLAFSLFIYLLNGEFITGNRAK